MRGYFGIGIYHAKTPVNVGTLWRSAYQLGAAFIFTIGRRYPKQASDTTCAWRHIPLFEYETLDDFARCRPLDCPLVSIEMGGRELHGFNHPERCIYLLGAEDHGLPDSVLRDSQYHIALPSVRSLSYNVAVAGSIVMYDRLAKNA